MGSEIRKIIPSDYEFIYNTFRDYRPNIFGYYSNKIYQECVKLLIEHDNEYSITTVGVNNNIPKLFMISITNCDFFIKRINKQATFSDKIKLKLDTYGKQDKINNNIEYDIKVWFNNMYTNYNNAAYGLMQFRDKNTNSPLMKDLMKEQFIRIMNVGMDYNVGQIKKDNKESIVSSRINGAKLYNMGYIYMAIFDIKKILKIGEV